MKKALLALAVSLLVSGATAAAEPLPQGYWTDLLHLGSDMQQVINGRAIGTDFLDGEATIRPIPGDEVSGIPNASENPMVWTVLHDNDGVWSTYPDLNEYTKYWHIYVISPDERQVKFVFKHDDDFYVWNNGQMIIQHDGYHGGGDETEEATLAAGINSITLKLAEGGGGDMAAIRVTDLNDQPFDDLTYTFVPGTTISNFTVSDVTSGSTLYTNEATVDVSFDVVGGTPVGYMITETPTEPALGDDWAADIPQYTITSLVDGEVGTLYAWVKDDADNIVGAQADILFNTTALNPTAASFTVDSATQVTVEWFTDAAAYGKLDYKEADATEWQTTGWSDTPGTVHTFVIDGLDPGTVYSYIYHSNEVSSAEEIYAHVIEPAPLVDGSISIDPYFNAAVVSWQTDAEGYGKVGYGLNPPDPTTGYENETEWGPLALGHSRLVTGLQPGTVYHYAVKANGGDWSSDALFSTAPAAAANTFDSGVDLSQWHKVSWRFGNVAPFHNISGDNGRILLHHACDGMIAERDMWFKLGNEPAEMLVKDGGFQSPYQYHGTLITFIDGTGHGLVLWQRMFKYESEAMHVTRFESLQEFADQFWSNEGVQPSGEFLAERNIWDGTNPIEGYTTALDNPVVPENLYYRFIVTDTQFRVVVTQMLDSGELVTIDDSGMVDHSMNLVGGRFGIGSYNSTGDGDARAWFDNFYAAGETYNPPSVTGFILTGADTNSSEITSNTILQVKSFEAADADGAIAGYQITTSSEAPAFDDPNWSPMKPGIAVIPADTPEGDVTFYGWALDDDGNVSMAPGVHTIYYQTSPVTVIDGPNVELTYTRATISWTTDAPVKAQVQWGESTNFEWFTNWETNPTTDHSFTFAIPFKPGVTYHYRLMNGSSPDNGYTFTSLNWGGDVIRTIYVDANTSVAAADQDGSQAAPFALIMDAVASVGDVSAEVGGEVQILVAPGTYNENLLLTDSALNLTLGEKWLKIIGTDGRDSTIIECDGSKKVFQFVQHLILDGLTFHLNGSIHENDCSGGISSQMALLNCRIANVGRAYGAWMWGVHGVLLKNCEFNMTGKWQAALKVNDRPSDLVIEDSTFIGCGRAMDYHAHWNSVNNVWYRNNRSYNTDGILLKDRALSGFHIYNNIFVNGTALAEFESTDLQFYNNTLINANVPDASLTNTVFNNIIVTTGLNSWNGDTVQYQLADTDSPVITSDSEGRNLIAPTLDSISGMFVSTDFWVMEEDPENPGNFIQTDQINPDFARLDPTYAGAQQAAGNGLAVFEGVTAPIAGIYGTERGDSVSIGAAAVEAKAWPVEGDANMDCKVNIIDLIFVRNRLNQDPNSDDNWQADVNGDGKINIIDLIYVRNRLNTKCE